MNLIRSVLHLLWMAVTVVPWATFVLIVSPFISSTRLYWICAGWLSNAVWAGGWILGIRNRVSGYEHLPRGKHVIEYSLRLNNPGRFALPPTRVEAMYAPETFGEAPNAAVEVAP